MIEQISVAREEALVMRHDLDLHILKHDAFGKGLMKKCKMSPDAFIQTALQFAYYKVNICEIRKMGQ